MSCDCESGNCKGEYRSQGKGKGRVREKVLRRFTPLRTNRCVVSHKIKKRWQIKKSEFNSPFIRFCVIRVRDWDCFWKETVKVFLKFLRSKSFSPILPVNRILKEIRIWPSFWNRTGIPYNETKKVNFMQNLSQKNQKGLLWFWEVT